MNIHKITPIDGIDRMLLEMSRWSWLGLRRVTDVVEVHYAYSAEWRDMEGKGYRIFSTVSFFQKHLEAGKTIVIRSLSDYDVIDESTK